jgi:hypothetical protein
MTTNHAMRSKFERLPTERAKAEAVGFIRARLLHPLIDIPVSIRRSTGLRDFGATGGKRSGFNLSEVIRDSAGPIAVSQRTIREWL